MEASVIQGPKQIKIVSAPLPEPGLEEVLVKLGGTGVCVSNLPVWEGRPWFNYPFDPGAPGHEGYGIVESTGSMVKGLVKGDKVALLSYHAYAQYDKTHMSNVVKLPDSFDGKPFPGEPLACAVNIIRRSDIKEDQPVVVIGAGFIGCLLIQLLKHAGAEVIAVSRRKSSLQFAEISGAGHLVKFNEVWQAKEEIFKLAPRGVQRVIEATGVQSGIDLATEIISDYGKLIIAGYHQDGIRNINLQQWNWKALDVINAHERDPLIYISGLKEAIKLAEKGILRPENLITHHFDFRDINKAFNFLEQKPEGFLKGVIVYS